MEYIIRKKKKTSSSLDNNKIRLYPVTQPQTGILHEWMQHPNTSQGLLNYEVSLPPSVDVSRLQQAIDQTISNHSVLHTRFTLVDGKFMQYIDDTPIVSTLCSMEEGEYQRLIVQSTKPINHLDSPLFSITITKTEKAIHIAYYTSHAISDGTCSILFFREINERYHGLPVTVTDTPFRQFAEGEEAELNSIAYAEAKEYSTRTFADATFPELPCLHHDRLGALRRIPVTISRQSIASFISGSGISANRLFMAAYALALHAFSGESKIVFDSLYHGRDTEAKRLAHGMFVRNVPVLADFSAEEPTLQSLNATFSENFRGNPHGIYPFTHFCTDLKKKGKCTYSYVKGHDRIEFGNATYPIAHIGFPDSNDDVSFLVYEEHCTSHTSGNEFSNDKTGERCEGNYILYIEYNEARQDAMLMRRLVETIEHTVHQIISNGADYPLLHLTLVDEEQQAELLQLGTGTELPTDHRTITQMVDEQSLATPDNVAITDCNGSITYGELLNMSNRFAAYLTGQSIRQGDRVALMLPRRKEFVVAALGAIKAGAAYIPIDKDYPKERIDYMLSDAEVKTVVDMSTFDEMQKWQNNTTETTADSGDCSNYDSPAYIIYTSGTTGKPKGVVIPNRALSSFVRTCVKTYELSATDRIMCQGTFSFDASVEDLYPILTVGGQLHILEETKVKDLNAIAQYITDNGITGCNFTTQLGHLLMSTHPDLPLRYVTVGGEALSDVPENLSCRFFNSYGPTEFTVDATFWEHSNNGNGISAPNTQIIPIGRPVCNAQAYILDSHCRLLPRGCHGELYLSGMQLADGYLNHSELTAKAFVPNPYSAIYPTMYATGDVVCWMPDGNIQFIGRRDTQVKLRGYRIETGEVDMALCSYKGVDAAVTTVRKHNGRQILCSWYVSDKSIDEESLKHHLQHNLPAFMQPDSLIRVEQFPYMPNGKVDTDALKLNSETVRRTPYVGPTTEQEQKLIDIVEEITGYAPVGIDDDLFNDIGLSSLQVIRMAYLASQQGIRINVTNLYSQRTISNIIATTRQFWYLKTKAENCNADRPVMILVCGYVYTPIYELMTQPLSEDFDLLVFDAFFENFNRHQTASIQKLIDDYINVIDTKLQGRNISLVIGGCYGGDIAITLAERLQCETGIAYPVLTLEPYYERNKMTDPLPDDNPVFREQIRISNEIALSMSEPTYHGELTLICSAEVTRQKSYELPDELMTEEEWEAEKRHVERNLDLWRTNLPWARIMLVPGDHYNFMKNNVSTIIETAREMALHWQTQQTET